MGSSVRGGGRRPGKTAGASVDANAGTAGTDRKGGADECARWGDALWVGGDTDVYVVVGTDGYTDGGADLCAGTAGDVDVYVGAAADVCISTGGDATSWGGVGTKHTCKAVVEVVLVDSPPAM